MSRYKKPEDRIVNNEFWWAIIYLGRPVAFYPRYRDAYLEMKKSNKWFEDHQSGCRYSTKRYRFSFRGLEVDTYEHLWERFEKQEVKNHIS